MCIISLQTAEYVYIFFLNVKEAKNSVYNFLKFKKVQLVGTWSVCVCMQVVRAGVVRAAAAAVAAAASLRQQHPRVPRRRLPPLWEVQRRHLRVAAAPPQVAVHPPLQAWAVARRPWLTAPRRPSQTAPPLQPHLLSQLSPRTSTITTRSSISSHRIISSQLVHLDLIIILLVCLPWWELVVPWCLLTTAWIWTHLVDLTYHSIIWAIIITPVAWMVTRREKLSIQVPTATFVLEMLGKTRRPVDPRSWFPAATAAGQVRIKQTTGRNISPREPSASTPGVLPIITIDIMWFV